MDFMRLMTFFPSPPFCFFMSSTVSASIFTKSETCCNRSTPMCSWTKAFVFFWKASSIYFFRIRVANDGVDGRKSRVVVYVRPKEGIGRDNLVKHLYFFVFLEELLAAIIVTEMLDEVVHKHPALLLSNRVKSLNGF